MMNKPRLAPGRLCTGCMACHDSCRHGACVKVDAGKCVGCGLCEAACPIVSPVAKNSLAEAHVYGGWATSEAVRLDGASGGAFTGLAHSFFRTHDGEPVAVVGAALAGNRVRHVIVEREEDLHLLANSKYIQSDTAGIYRAVSDSLPTGHTLTRTQGLRRFVSRYTVLSSSVRLSRRHCGRVRPCADCR